MLFHHPISRPFLSRNLLAALLAIGCSSPEASTEAAVDETPGETDATDTTTQQERRACEFPIEPLAAPVSIQEVVDQINKLPKPLTLPCFIQSLSRPLHLDTSRSVFSAQPAAGERSPRFFIFSGPLILSVVPEGRGSSLLELSEVVTDFDSVKGELKFPIDRAITSSAPYEELEFNEKLTLCGTCHSAEKPAEGYPELATVSEALRPRWNDHVSLDSLRDETETCDWLLEPERCAMLDALFSGTVVPETFPETFSTF